MILFVYVVTNNILVLYFIHLCQSVHCSYSVSKLFGDGTNRVRFSGRCDKYSHCEREIIVVVCVAKMRWHGIHVCRTHCYMLCYVPIYIYISCSCIYTRTCVRDNITDATRSLFRRRQRVLAHTAVFFFFLIFFLRPRKKTRVRVYSTYSMYNMYQLST